ncbi:uncharacterized protein GGS25DRAFT_94825 [Hypoxylon fragiforme]|uniref:uncharacterized protein n=1 Tax=Hypoxylon fragiforme TaxID=63214 RepID=UPI0020C5FFAD|nr:uncharacterized protein GGS25DRAFT_94825 [Hypoxylon fragiforme]KAI2603478.1 hypothetical protein GGS25DRAFT_94825 [Hypoxylon fragiforme]
MQCHCCYTCGATSLLTVISLRQFSWACRAMLAASDVEPLHLNLWVPVSALYNTYMQCHPWIPRVIYFFHTYIYIFHILFHTYLLPRRL